MTKNRNKFNWGKLINQRKNIDKNRNRIDQKRSNKSLIGFGLLSSRILEKLSKYMQLFWKKVKN